MEVALKRGSEAGWFEQLPKVELHVHLEGAIPLDALWELVQKYGGDVPSRAALEQRFTYTDFPHFIQTWIWKNQFLREYEDFSFIAERAARDFASQNIRYAEVFYSPPDFAPQGLDPQRITEAIRSGLTRIPETEIALVADLVRDYGPEKGQQTLAAINEVQELGVVGIGIGGSEQTFPPEPFAPVYAAARKMGFRTSAHAGEAAGPASVWGAIRQLRVDRVGHGVRAGQDEGLLDYLAEKRVPVEMCPISNVRTGVVQTYEQHPIRRFFERGLLVNINTDDPKMFGNSLADEFRLLAEKHGFTHDEIRQLVLNSIEMSWMSAARKQALKGTFTSGASWSE